ncbi:MAG TPA: pyruvate dehydrogenase (acetyl-transferring) E1 component subunit alpha [bacterium]|jgi:pyruvate dehydrogenase E1 component alpha subunit
MSLPTEQETGRATANRRVRTQEAEPSLFEAFDPLKGERLEIMNPNGEIANPRWMPRLSEQKLVEIYRMMLLARIADTKAVSYQRQGRLFTLPPSMGQEAAAVGSASVLEVKDWIAPAYRELGALLTHGVPLWKIYLYHSGSEFGAVYPENVRVLPQSVPISSQLLHAAGIGHAINYKGLKEVVITYFGDGGTSEGDFHEALNWAAVFSCPVIFFCNNNQYAISHPRTHQTKSATLAQKAIAYGMPGIQVDGNDIFAVYRATKDAADYARAGNGPVMIEAETYRLGAHTTSDDPTRYRQPDEEKLWHERDPLLRMRRYLEAQKLWSEPQEQQAAEEATKIADEAFKQASAVPMNTPEEVMSHLFETPPEELKKQLASLKSFLSWKEGR